MSKNNRTSKPVAPVLGILVIIAGILGLGSGGGTGLIPSQGTQGSASSSQVSEVQEETPAPEAVSEEAQPARETPAQPEEPVVAESEESSRITIRVHGQSVEISGSNTPDDLPSTVEELAAWPALKGASVLLVDDYADSSVYAEVKQILEEAGAELYTEQVE